MKTFRRLLTISLFAAILALAATAYATARTALTVQDIGTSSHAITWSTIDASSDGEFLNYSGRILLLCKHGPGATESITLKSVADIYGRTGDATMTCAANGTSIAGPFRPFLWNTSAGYVYFDFADGTSLQFAAVQYTP